MSSTNKTTNYALPQFIPTDKPTWLGDVNAAMLAIDTAMADNHTLAEGANTTAAGAEAKVQAAVDTANEAKVDSAAALQTATAATGVAQNALTASTTATQTANAASTQAQQAAGTATQASAVATSAVNLANETKAELTEFEHGFTANIRPAALSDFITSISANWSPAVFNVTAGLTKEIPAGTSDIFSFNGNPWGLNETNYQIYSIDYGGSPVILQGRFVAAENKTYVSLYAKEQISNIGGRIAYIISTTWSSYKIFRDNNMNAARLAMEDVLPPLCVFGQIS